jgi:hypothetical protein
MLAALDSLFLCLDCYGFARLKVAFAIDCSTDSTEPLHFPAMLTPAMLNEKRIAKATDVIFLRIIPPLCLIRLFQVKIYLE